LKRPGTDYEDRYRTLLKISHAIVSILGENQLFRAVAEQIHKILPFDRTSITLYDPIRDSFRIHLLETTLSPLHLNQTVEIQRQGSAIGWVWNHRRYNLRPDLTKERPFFEDELYYREGLRCSLSLPLIAGGKVFGGFNVSNKFPNSYSEKEIEFLSLVADQIAVAFDNARAHETVKQLKDELDRENRYLREEIKIEYNFDQIVGRSAALTKILKRVEDVAATDSSILITGETGTGKELIARAIHHLSKRRQRALIKVNCAALPAGLIESELFGHEKGAFTGAVSKRIGRFELADGGTLFLDEIGELPQEIQAKLLRILQEFEFERIGSMQTIRVNIRVIAATNQNLEDAVRKNTFRADLYYRLNVFPIHLPPIRERKEDIAPLARFFVNKYMTMMNKQIREIAPETLDRLMEYPWPGNIRELENVIERAVILCKGPALIIEEDLLPLSLPDQDGSHLLSLEEVEREHILRILESTRWVIEGPRGAAKFLDLHPNTLRSRMGKLGIRRSGHGIS